MRTIKLLLILINIGTIVLSQDLPIVIPPSPQAQAYLRYGEIPVDYCTGVPKIEIPLYTLKTSFVEIPITVSYHASGIKVDDIPSPVGLGWVLNAGGAVARTTIGNVDESWVPQARNPIPPRTLKDMQEYIDNYSNDLENFNPFAINSFDMFSDKYTFYSSGINGSFRLENYTNKPVTIPFDNNRINLNQINNIITITDTKGNDWVFGDKELSRFEFTQFIFYPTTWYLTKILNSNKTDSVVFEYIDDLKGGLSTVKYSRTFWDNDDEYPDEFRYGLKNIFAKDIIEVNLKDLLIEAKSNQNMFQK